MLGYLARALKRLAVLLPGIVIAYIAIRDIYPFLNLRLPEVLALFVAYVVAAYLLVPAAFRLFRLFVTPKHIPLYCTTPDGFACDPINIGIIGSRTELVQAMEKAGWHIADAYTVRNVMKLAASIVLRRPYSTAPFSGLFLFGRRQDIGFQKPVEDSPRQRHHVRFWAVVETGSAEVQEHVSFWQRLHPRVSSSRLLWVGAASQDIGIGVIRHSAQLTHMIHPDTDAERDLIADDLSRSGQVKHVTTVKAGKPYSLLNRVVGGYLVADGDMKICELN